MAKLSYNERAIGFGRRLVMHCETSKEIVQMWKHEKAVENPDDLMVMYLDLVNVMDEAVDLIKEANRGKLS